MMDFFPIIRKIRCIGAGILACLMLLLSACSHAAGEVIEDGGSQGVLPTSTIVPAETPFEQIQAEDEFAKINAIKGADSMQEAMGFIENSLALSDVEYKWIVRDYFYAQGEKIPAQWLFAVNEMGEWVDVLMMETDQETLGTLAVPDALVYDGMPFYRKNEIKSYYHKFGYPHYLSGGLSVTFSSNNGKFSVLYGGQDFAMHDVNTRHKAEVLWNGEWITTGARPEDEPVYVDNPSADYKTYLPAESMQAEIDEMQKRLRDTGLGYEWEIKESIEIENIEYPVIWMYAVNDKEEWVDIVFSEDPDLCYLLNEHRDIFWELREEQRNRYNQLHPGRAEDTYQGIQGNTNEWIIQDVFYHGYSYFMDGHGLAIQDCGSPWSVTEWVDELQSYGTYYSRNDIWGINVFMDE